MYIRVLDTQMDMLSLRARERECPEGRDLSLFYPSTCPYYVGTARATPKLLRYSIIITVDIHNM